MFWFRPIFVKKKMKKKNAETMQTGVQMLIGQSLNTLSRSFCLSCRADDYHTHGAALCQSEMALLISPHILRSVI